MALSRFRRRREWPLAFENHPRFELHFRFIFKVTTLSIFLHQIQSFIILPVAIHRSSKRVFVCEPARWIVELAEKCVGWEACVTTAPELPKIPEDDRAAFLISLQSQIEMVRSVNDEAKANGTLVKWGTSMNDARYKDSAQYDRQYFGAGRQVLTGEKEQLDILLLEQIALLHSKY